MKHYMDCEFDGFGGQLISMAIVSETGRSMYAVMDYREIKDPWVRENVIPHVLNVPLERIAVCGLGVTPGKLSFLLEEYFKSDQFPHVIADWPDDLKYLNEALITGPGTMIEIPGILMSVKRCEPYPTAVTQAIRHNAWWDAVVLWKHLTIEDRTNQLMLFVED